jgi:dihydroorotate dehydrogenase electron transfer subunit
MRLSSTTIISNTEIRPGLRLLQVRSPYLAQAAQPGQYTMVRCCDALATDPLLRRPFFIHTTQREREQFSLLVAARGRGSAWLARQPEQATLDIMGPLGQGWKVPPTSRNLLLIGEGPLLASLTLLAQTAIEQELTVTLLCQFASAAEIYPPTLLSPEIEYHVTMPDSGAKPLVELVGNYLAWADTVFCAVSLTTAQTLYQRYEPLRHKYIAQCLITHPFACASGVCLTCAIDTRAGPRLVCRDGPVFALGEVVAPSL